MADEDVPTGYMPATVNEQSGVWEWRAALHRHVRPVRWA